MKDEYDFSGGVRGRFYTPKVKITYRGEKRMTIRRPVLTALEQFTYSARAHAEIRNAYGELILKNGGVENEEERKLRTELDGARSRSRPGT